MPVVFRHGGFAFFFYSNEGDPREPIHIHVRGGSGEAKIWLSPLAVAHSFGYDAKTLNELLGVVEENQSAIERYWNEYFA